MTVPDQNRSSRKTATVLALGLLVGFSMGYLGTSRQRAVIRISTFEKGGFLPKEQGSTQQPQGVHHGVLNPVFLYPEPDRILRAKNWKTGQDVEFKTYYMCDCGPNEGRVLKTEGLPRAEALRWCATWPLCQFVICDVDSVCFLRSPSCNLLRNQDTNTTVSVITERTATSISLWHHLNRNLKPLEGLVRNRLSASTRVSNAVCDYRRPNWGSGKKRKSTEYPFIEVTKEDKDAMQNKVVVDPIHKLVFFRVPKVMSTNIVGLYDRLLGHNDIVLDTNLTMDLHGTPSTRFRPRMNFGRLTLMQANQIMNDPSWKKVVFLREPSERFLSYYLEKVARPKGFCKIFGKPEGGISFDEMVSFASMPGPRPFGTSAMVDPHYRGQMLVNRLYKFLPQMDFIAWATTENAELMLKKYGLWKEFGRKELWPFGFMRNEGGHRTDSGSLYDKHYNAKLLGMIKEAYHMDYVFLDHIGLKDRNSTPVSGMQLEFQNTQCCDGIGCFPAVSEKQ